MKRENLGLVQSRRPLQAWARSAGCPVKCSAQCRGHQAPTRTRGGSLGRAEPALQGRHRSSPCLAARTLLSGQCCSSLFPPSSPKPGSFTFLITRALRLGRGLHQCFEKDFYQLPECLQWGCVRARRVGAASLRPCSTYSQLSFARSRGRLLGPGPGWHLGGWKMQAVLLAGQLSVLTQHWRLFGRPRATEVTRRALADLSRLWMKPYISPCPWLAVRKLITVPRASRGGEVPGPSLEWRERHAPYPTCKMILVLGNLCRLNQMSLETKKTASLLGQNNFKEVGRSWNLLYLIIAKRINISSMKVMLLLLLHLDRRTGKYNASISVWF